MSFQELSQDPFGLTYASLVAVGGLIGFLKASSLPSLVAGLASGAIISYGTVRAVRNNKQVDVILGISVFLLVFFGRRFLNSKKIMPAGLVTALSAISVFRYGSRLAQ
ncbi:TMEM14-domain-containing protein [Atractiella rhizophila]|nr:TMEM14-domain-containing protein [Atractiella rhizophila]KAH8922738.1 TMEM14-domain-containing protein [Atractiella rhizophila]KAH8928393.1 TMEM14-domain-containing protein [Atractiella rhizophila]